MDLDFRFSQVLDTEYKAHQNDDGTWNIMGVPIFELGEHRGFDYDDKWWGLAIANFEEYKAKSYLPTIIVGHTSDEEDAEEKPVVGFMDNLKNIGGIIFSDLVNVANDTFELIKNKAFPYRSPEVSPTGAFFSALALLGSSRPHFKFPALSVQVFGQFAESPDTTTIMFDEYYGASITDVLAAKEVRIQTYNATDKIREIGWAAQDLIDRAITDPSLDAEDRKYQVESVFAEWGILISEQGDELALLVGQIPKVTQEEKMKEKIVTPVTTPPAEGILARFNEGDQAIIQAMVDTTVQAATADISVKLAESQTEATNFIKKFDDLQATTLEKEQANASKNLESSIEDMRSGRVDGLMDGNNVSYAMAPALLDQIPFAKLSDVAGETIVKFKEGDKEVELPLAQRMVDLFYEAGKLAMDGKLLVPLTQMRTGEYELGNLETPPDTQMVQVSNATHEDRVMGRMQEICTEDKVRYSEITSDLGKLKDLRKRAVKWVSEQGA